MQIVKTIGQAFEVCHQIQQKKSVSSSVQASPRRAGLVEKNDDISGTQPMAPSETIISIAHHPETFHATASTSVMTFRDSISRRSIRSSNEHPMRMRKSTSEMGAGTARNGFAPPRTLPLSLSGTSTDYSSDNIYYHNRNFSENVDSKLLQRI